MGEFGVLTIATGSKRFVKMAVFLAISIRRTNPNWPIALLTDSKDEYLNEFFDHIIPFSEDMPAGFTHKLFMYDYSPFEETLFIDSDSLVINDLTPFFAMMKVSDVSAQGFKFTDREWAGVHAKDIIDKTGTKYLLMHNGGVYYFKKSKKAYEVFRKAKNLLNEYEHLGFYKLRGKTAHEPLMSTAMSLNDMNAFDDQCRGMRTFVDISSSLEINVLKGKCEFYEFIGTNRRKVNPIIIHFSGAHADWFHYKRETAKLAISEKFKWMPDGFISTVVNALYNPPYILFIFCYRMMKFLLRREKFKIFPLTPTLRYK